MVLIPGFLQVSRAIILGRQLLAILRPHWELLVVVTMGRRHKKRLKANPVVLPKSAEAVLHIWSGHSFAGDRLSFLLERRGFTLWNVLCKLSHCVWSI